MSPSAGIFFVVRLPSGWQLCTFRYAEYGLISFPDTWFDVCGTLLRIWLLHVREHQPEAFAACQAAVREELAELTQHADAFPFGCVVSLDDSLDESERFEVHHGGNITRSMQVPRRDIEREFGIVGKARWIVHPGVAGDPTRMERFRRILAPQEDWGTMPGIRRPGVKSKR